MAFWVDAGHQITHFKRAFDSFDANWQQAFTIGNERFDRTRVKHQPTS